MSARRAAVRHCENSTRDRLESTASREAGNLSGDYQSGVSTNMGSSLRPGDCNGTAIQTEGSELSQERLISNNYSYEAPPAVEHEMQRELKYFFMNPYEKYRAKGRKPWKLAIQIFKIVLVTTQLVLFGNNQFSVVTFMEENSKAFEHIFLEEWQSSYDSGVYPSTKSLYAVYEVDTFFKHVNHTIVKYSNLNTIAIGTYVLPPERQVMVSIVEYEKFDVYEEYFELNLTTHKHLFYVNVTDNMTEFNLKDYLHENYNYNINFDRLETVEISFQIQSVHVKSKRTLSPPDCIIFGVKIVFDNKPHSGRVAVELIENHHVDVNCTAETRKKASDAESWAWRASVTLMDVVIMSLCIVSSILCSRSLLNGYILRKKTDHFFERYYRRKLTRSERMEFVNLWYVMIILSDMLTLAGTICKILIQEQRWSDYDSCSLLLGAGCFLVWFGILRYLGFFHSYSIPVITLKCAMPNVLRFLLCAAIMYLAYGFCGWVVLGPYHKKFRTMGISIECMFSLINGDDMFATFRAMSETNQLIYYFSRIYLYTFISLFIYVVLSLFIAVIMDTYETVKDFRARGECENDLQVFIKKCEETPDSGCFRLSSESPRRGFFNRCCKKRTTIDERTPLMD